MCRLDICWGQTNISSQWQWISWSSLHCRRRCCYVSWSRRRVSSLWHDNGKKSSSIPIKASLGIDEDIIALTMTIITINERILKGRMMWQCNREPTISTRLLKVIISELWWFRKGHQLHFSSFFLVWFWAKFTFGSFIYINTDYQNIFCLIIIKHKHSTVSSSPPLCVLVKKAGTSLHRIHDEWVFTFGALSYRSISCGFTRKIIAMIFLIARCATTDTAVEKGVIRWLMAFLPLSHPPTQKNYPKLRSCVKTLNLIRL